MDLVRVEGSQKPLHKSRSRPEYDAIGNPLTYDDEIFAWEGRKLTSFNNSDLAISYSYNENGIRTSKTINGVTTNYRLSGDKVTFEQTGSDTLYYVYDTQDQLISMILNGTEYAYLRNAQNDIVGLIDSAGTQVVAYTYSTWGEVILIDGSLKDTVGVKNPYRYRGYRYDSETGLYYLQSRYYNPQWGRFINADAVSILGFRQVNLIQNNLFTYSLNNAVNKSDSSGYWAQDMDGFDWLNGGAEFKVDISPLFLSKSFCVAFALDIIRMKGKYSWNFGRSYAGLNFIQLAAECFAHAIMYYYTNITVKLFGRLRNWNNSGKEINVAANDNRSNQFHAIWFGAPFIRNYLLETIGVIMSFK